MRMIVLFTIGVLSGAGLLIGQEARPSDAKFVDNVPTGFWWRDATTEVKLDFLRGFQAGLSVSNSTRYDIPVTDLASRLDKFYLVEANRPITVAKAFIEVTKPGAPPIRDIPLPTVSMPPQGAPQAQTSPGGVYRVGGGVTAPALLYKVEPDYSEEARRAHLEGVVVLYVEVDPTGQAVNPRVIRSLGLGLDEKAIEAVRKWKFRPGYKDGKPVTVAATIEINFQFLPPPPKEPDNQAAGPGDGHWIRIRSAHFEVNTSSGEKRGQDLAALFESAYGVFATFTNGVMPARPTRIVAFGSHAEYAPYQITEFAAAYYNQTPEDDFIVLDDRTNGPVSVIHEYTHLIARHANFATPPWLTEGLADVYSTLTPQRGGVLIGTPPPGYLDSLSKNEWVPLKTIIDAGQKSPYYHEKAKANDFYQESWALTHMLKLTAKYGPRSLEFMKLVNSGTSSERALKSVYHESIGEIETDLVAYLRMRPFPTVMVPVKTTEATVAGSAAVYLKPGEVEHLLKALPKAKWRPSIEVHPVSERPPAK